MYNKAYSIIEVKYAYFIKEKYTIQNYYKVFTLKQSKDDYINLLEIYNKHIIESNAIKKRNGMHDYSLINALLKKTDEVHLHSNFIYSMINPEGSHYCGNKFLEFFLESINEKDFINLNNARVHKEKGKIDLLIEDGEKIIIIENKLRAKDQKHQISRYIKYVLDEYIEEDSKLSDKIHIVYLSEYKKLPTQHEESTVGFDVLIDKSKKMIWKNIVVKLCDKKILDLPQDTEFKFKRVKHSDNLYDWVNNSIEYLANKPNNESLIYAFKEYGLILERLKNNNNWRNMMSLDEYTLNIQDDKKQKEMYTFMCEANERLNDYIAKKLYKEIVQLFPDKTELILNNKRFNEFTENSCKMWFRKKRNCKDIGFVFHEYYYFALGENNIAYGLIDEGWNIETNRENLQTNKNKNLFLLIEELKKYTQK